MKHDIDIFYHPTHPRDHRWDRDQNAKILNIVFNGGTFGNFLKFFIDKFSTLSPDIDGDPFTGTGISHRTDEILRDCSKGIIKVSSMTMRDNRISPSA